VFARCVGKAAFVDKIVLSCSERPSDGFEEFLSNFETHGVLHRRARYSRRVSASENLTENPVRIIYGRVHKFPNLPQAQLTIQSERLPVTAAQALLIAKRLMNAGSSMKVSSLELTFDLRVGTVAGILDHIVHRAKRERLLVDAQGRRTLYVGSPKSLWQVRVYQKTRSIVRIEFILRQRFLSKYEIRQPEEVLLLRNLKIWDLFSLRRFSRSRAIRATRDLQDKHVRFMIANWPLYRRPLNDLVYLLKKTGIDPWLVLRKTRLQERLEAMQRRLLW
jgi:hypothetical protein